jgi:hypothetical protein
MEVFTGSPLLRVGGQRAGTKDSAVASGLRVHTMAQRGVARESTMRRSGSDHSLREVLFTIALWKAFQHKIHGLFLAGEPLEDEPKKLTTSAIAIVILCNLR